MHPKKGFTLKESNYTHFMARIHQVIEVLNWDLFCEKRPSVDEELAPEFYANLTSSKLIEVPVHGIKVPINSNTINEFFELPDFENDEYSSLMSNIEPENLQEILEELTGSGSKWTVSKQGIHTCRREYLTPFSKTIDVGKIILREMQNCVVRRFGLACFPFTITILCLKAKIHTNQRLEETKDPKEEEEDPTEIKPEQEDEVPDETKPMELEAEPDVKTSMFRTQSPRLDLRDELSKLMDIM
ncbi:hypothetical protein J1N35_004964 [Gossypium stocksii]|uniref:Putative plant transposon protein domain-containing protein n=1 Tax=Gossypium stocksii TaxID=47602 RepID=A0A9D4AI64_9ROSI|nr:hypothetical protein J1N35_004964 [Gossypium stocksii]